MKSFEERTEEILARSSARIAQRKKNVRRAILTCVPIVLCVCLAGGYLATGGFFASKDMAMENMEMDSEANGSSPYYGAAVPEAPEMAPMEGADMNSGMHLELYRTGYSFSYNEPDVLDMFLNILEGEMLPPPGGRAPADGDPIEYYFRFEPEKMIRDDRHLVKLTYPDGETIFFTLEGNWLTRQDNQAYILTDEQASILYKLLELRWEGDTALTKEQIIQAAKAEITWNYYAATAEQASEDGDWTVTFWSRDRESFQVIITDKYGNILQVQDYTAWTVNE